MLSTATSANVQSPQAAAVDPPTDVPENLRQVRARVEAALAARDAKQGPDGVALPPVRLVAVSKTKPAEAVAAAYACGHRHFGENYVKELVEKAPALPADVQWHFIGHVQSNKATALLKGCPYLSCVETVDSEKLAKALHRAVQSAGRTSKLRVMVQVNSSGEESKNGVAPAGCVDLCTVIAEQCDNLQLAGLMTIGAPDYTGCRSEDFETLRRCRQEVASTLGLEASDLELSMGMSNDFETAILEGSTSVRVGSSIFGARARPEKPAAPQS